MSGSAFCSFFISNIEIRVNYGSLHQEWCEILLYLFLRYFLCNQKNLCIQCNNKKINKRYCFAMNLDARNSKKNYQKHLKHDSSHIWVVVTENWLHVNMNGIYEQDTCLLTSSKMHKTALTLEDLKKNYGFSTKMSLVQFILFETDEHKPQIKKKRTSTHAS
jgi:hypothetical protein